MPSLISRAFGISEASSGRRPQMLEFQGLNWSSTQADGLICALPMWEPPGVPALDLGPLGLVGKPIGTILRTQDPYFGDVYYGDGTGVSTTSTPARGYDFGYVRELNFGIGPQPFTLAFWFLSTIASPAVDTYLMAYDDPGQTNFPGWAVSFDAGGTIACNTGNTTFADGGFKTPAGFMDQKWHHLAFSHLPGAALDAATNAYYVDGKLVAFANTGCKNVGPVGPTAHLYFGVDDDGTSQPFGGYFCDFRAYNTALGASDAAQMFHPDTRWELYQPARKSFYPLGLPPVTASGAGTAAGAATASGVGSALAAGAGSSVGAAAASATSAPLASAAGSAAGSATAPGVGSALSASAGASAGLASASAVGSAASPASGSAAGLASASAVGSALAAGVGSSAGAAAASAAGSALSASTGASAGSSTASAAGASLVLVAGTSAGSASATAVGLALVPAVGSAAGSSTASAVGSALAKAAGTAAGVSTASAVGSSSANGQGVGAAAGSSTASAVGSSLALAAGSAAGSASAVAVGSALAAGSGTASASASASAVGLTLVRAAGTAAGSSTAAGVSPGTTPSGGASYFRQYILNRRAG